MKFNSLIACHECDLLHHIQRLPKGGVALCRRCGAVLFREKQNSLNRTLALVITGLILYGLANVYPFLTLKIEGQVQEAVLITGVKELYLQGMWEVAVLVFLTTVLVPLIQLLGTLYVFLPMKFDRLPWKLSSLFRFLQVLQPWGMMEVFMVAILVSVVKLTKMATILPGIALYAFMILIFVLAAASASLDPHIVWKRLEVRR